MLCPQAVECRHDNCVALLLEYKVELDSVDKDGNTCLHIAAGDGSSKIAKMLCQSGANMTIKNRVGISCSFINTLGTRYGIID